MCENYSSGVIHFLATSRINSRGASQCVGCCPAEPDSYSDAVKQLLRSERVREGLCVCLSVCVCVCVCVSEHFGPSAHKILMATEEEWFPWQQRDLR